MTIRSNETEADDILKDWSNTDAVLSRVGVATIEVAAAVIGRLSSTGTTGEKMHALRDACSILVHQKLNSDLIESNRKLDRSATILTRVGIIVSAVIGIAGIAIPLLRGLI